MTEADARRDRLFRERVAAHDQAAPGYRKIWGGLESMLLGLGGSAVVPPVDPDPMVSTFRDLGEIQRTQSVVVVPGIDGDCHTNVVRLWRSGDLTSIGTGYALSGDLWREHSWGWDFRNQLVETTRARERYFGIRIKGDDADRFAAFICPEN